MGKLRVTQVRSTIGCTQDQIATLRALGLRKIRSQKIHEDNPTIRGMIQKVKHLVEVEEIEE
ncbi:50S ribosomal protein L30 [Caldicoprobacter faecalis]|uniref:Large ribosomal subunit protein uL30 n=1 Tax=Caldicoprobacter faecalis TaxID=937334 RepID=A0A1I5TXW3_9FIRM|nr:50S ribosomal protein L30 [Caldicoprobacter faecalis]PZN10463.1 MAG: 50S ribosomal protein L30 [Caldicoprobacter oshimai]SFP87874.1 LSU ribosomal protein L30P [Caldicoprobacter faecalis]